jgi:hypothetical protein
MTARWMAAALVASAVTVVSAVGHAQQSPTQAEPYVSAPWGPRAPTADAGTLELEPMRVGPDRAPPPPRGVRDSDLVGSYGGDPDARARDDSARLWAMIGASSGAWLISGALIILPVLIPSASGAGGTQTWQLATMITGAALGWVAPPAAATLVGGAMGGRGNFGMAFVGHLVGMFVPLVGPFAGSAVGYEWAHRDAVNREGTRRVSTRARGPSAMRLSFDPSSSPSLWLSGAF